MSSLDQRGALLRPGAVSKRDWQLSSEDDKEVSVRREGGPAEEVNALDCVC